MAIELKDGDTYANWLLARAENLAELYTMRDNGEDPKVMVDCGIPEVNEAGVPERGMLTVVGAHAGHGKSAIAATFLEGAARQGYHALGFFFEDPADMLTDRTFSKMLSNESVVRSATDLRRLKTVNKTGKLASADEMRRVLFNVALKCDDWASRIRKFSNTLTSDALFAKIKEFYNENTALIVVDYAQIFGAEGIGKEQVIEKLATQLNKLAIDLNVAVLLLSQVQTDPIMKRGQLALRSWKFVNKDAVPDRAAIEGFVPITGDLAWAPGALTQRARSVIFVFRPGPIFAELKIPHEDNTMELVFAKNNYGDTPPTIVLGWEGKTTRVYSLPKIGRRLGASL